MNADRRKVLAKKGISHALLVMLIIVLAVAVFGVVAAVIYGWFGATSVKVDASVTKLDLVASGDSVLMLRNTGNVRLTSATASMTCEQTAAPTAPTITLPGDGLDPGKSVAVVWDAGGLVPGEKCTISITGDAANGASWAASASAVVRP